MNKLVYFLKFKYIISKVILPSSCYSCPYINKQFTL